MKKFLSVLLVVILCFSVFSVSAGAADEDIVVSIGGGKAHQGGTITLPVTLDSNNGLTALGIKISYDSDVLEIYCPNHQSGKNCSPSIEKYNLASGDNGLNSQYHTVNPYLIQWAYPVVNGSITENVTKTGTLAKITFKVKDDAPLGETKVKVEVDQASEYDGTRCTSVGGEATVTVVDATHVYDDKCDAECNVCGATRTITHTYELMYDETNHYDECTVCGDKINVEEHSFDNACDTTCNVCGYERTPEPHKVSFYTFANATNYPFTLSNGIYTSTNKANSSLATATLTATASGTITIKYYTSTESGYDKLIIQLNSTGKVVASGTTSWTSVTIPVVAGDTIYITYSKDSSQSSGSDLVKFELSPNYGYVLAEDMEPTCEDAVICSICGETVKEALEHTYTNTCDTTCNVCGDIRNIKHIFGSDNACTVCGLTRSAPELSYKYSGTVVLVAIEDYEYSLDGENWQTSNVFTGLLGSTTYTFYQRAINTLEDEYLPLKISLKEFQKVPDAPIVLGYSDTVVQLVAQSGIEYSLDGVNWQKSNIFRKLSPITEYTFYQRLAETDSAEASEKSEAKTFTTAKAKQPLIPSAPTVLSVTSYSVTLNPVEGCEYSMNGYYWQSSSVFDDLYYGTEYTFYQRYAETETTVAGESSEGITVKTLKGTPSRPYTPTLYSKSYNTVTLKSRSGYEYSIDGVNWQTNNVFPGLLPDMYYKFYQRVAENDEHYASAASPALSVKTDAAPYTSGDIDNNESINLKDLVTLSRYVAGWELDIAYSEVLDVNGDGVADLNDVNHLALYLAGWDVEIY